jgi:hypothetical protein
MDGTRVSQKTIGEERECRRRVGVQEERGCAMLKIKNCYFFRLQQCVLRE